MNAKLEFGTDGIRGRVGEFPIDCNTVLQLGWALGNYITQNYGPSKVLIGKDTRISGYLIESLFEAGLIASGCEAMLLGPIPTPGIAYLIRAFRARAGVVISASHNVYSDNGIKLFNENGFKMDSKDQKRILESFDLPLKMVPSEQLGRAKRVDAALERYVEYCKGKFNFNLSGLKVVFDGANGAGYKVGPAVFHELGAHVESINISPDGTNINDQSGSIYPEGLREMVLKNQADIGVGLDGDGDRVVIVTKTGKILDGDDLLYLLSRYHTQKGMGVVGTVMSNNGLEMALERQKIPFKRTPVGDHHVVDALIENRWLIGGEPSGHLIQLDKNTCSDGIISALSIISIAYKEDQDIDSLLDGFHKLPSILKNIPVGHINLDDHQESFAAFREALGPHGKLLIRKSGTEPVVRILIESQDADAMHSVCQSVETLFKTAEHVR